VKIGSTRQKGKANALFSPGFFTTAEPGSRSGRNQELPQGLAASQSSRPRPMPRPRIKICKPRWCALHPTGSARRTMWTRRSLDAGCESARASTAPERGGSQPSCKRSRCPKSKSCICGRIRGKKDAYLYEYARQLHAWWGHKAPYRHPGHGAAVEKNEENLAINTTMGQRRWPAFVEHREEWVCRSGQRRSRVAKRRSDRSSLVR